MPVASGALQGREACNWTQGRWMGQVKAMYGGWVEEQKAR
jgi:hypothetical protein